MKFDNKKRITCIFILALILTIVLNFTVPENQLPKYTNLILVLVTMFYAYFTFLMLIISKTYRPLPYIDAEFIITNKLTPEFIEKYGIFLREDDRFKIIENEAKNPGFNKNIVFLKVTNIGSGVALDVVFRIKYQFNNIADYRDLERPLTFGNIEKEGGYSIKLVDVYNNPNSDTDYFKLGKCILEFNDICNKQSEEGGYKTDLLQEIKAIIEEGVSINFSREKA